MNQSASPSRNEQGKCVRCDNALTAEEIQHPEKDDDGDVICEQCWRDLYLGDCARCGESVDKVQLKAEVGHLIGIWRDAPACGADELKAGYYIVLRWPFFLDGMITGSFFDTALRRVADLDDEGKGAAEEETCLSAPMCHHCQGEVSRAIVAARFTGSETPRGQAFGTCRQCGYAVALPDAAASETAFTKEDAAKLVERKAQVLTDEYCHGDTGPGGYVWSNKEAEWQVILLEELAEEMRNAKGL